ncbi:MAG: DNA gyrase inhibitor YacG [Pseudomonadota bacterium]
MKTVACPHCGKAVEWLPQSRWRPFCSERCRLIDFGAWAQESYAVPAQSEDAPELDAAPEDSERY